MDELAKFKNEPEDECVVTIRLNRSHILVDDMPEPMRNNAIYFSMKAMENFTLEQNLATYVKT